MAHPILLFVILYILGTASMWLYLKLAYSKKGIYSYSKPDTFDVFLTLLPMFNLALSIIGWIWTFPIKSDDKANRLAQMFFGIKKEL